MHSEWVPGASFKHKAREWRRAVTQMRDAPFATTIQEMVSNSSHLVPKDEITLLITEKWSLSPMFRVNTPR